jgi:hypothetical protein
MGNWGKRVHFPEDGHAADFSVWRTSVPHSFEDPSPSRKLERAMGFEPPTPPRTRAGQARCS